MIKPNSLKMEVFDTDQLMVLVPIMPLMNIYSHDGG